MELTATKDSTQIVLKISTFVVTGLLALGSTIPLIGEFAKILQKALEVIKQASHNEDAIVRLHDHMVDISDGLLPHLLPLSRITGFDNGLNQLMNLLQEISSYIENQKSLVAKVMSATDTKLVTQVDIYMKKLTDRKDRLMNLIAVDTNLQLTAVGKKKSEDHENFKDFLHKAPSIKEDNSRAPVNQDIEESSTDEKAIIKNTQVSRYSNNERGKFPAREKYVKNLKNN